MMQETRRVIFRYLIANIPQGTNKMVEGFSRAVKQMMINEHPEVCREYVIKVWGKYTNKENPTFEEARKVYFKTDKDAIEWAADFLYLDETSEAAGWLIKEGYIKEWKKSARFGYRWYLGITEKGWEIAHLYR